MLVYNTRSAEFFALGSCPRKAGFRAITDLGALDFGERRKGSEEDVAGKVVVAAEKLSRVSLF